MNKVNPCFIHISLTCRNVAQNGQQILWQKNRRKQTKTNNHRLLTVFVLVLLLEIFESKYFYYLILKKDPISSYDCLSLLSQISAVLHNSFNVMIVILGPTTVKYLTGRQTKYEIKKKKKRENVKNCAENMSLDITIVQYTIFKVPIKNHYNSQFNAATTERDLYPLKDNLYITLFTDVKW